MKTSLIFFLLSFLSYLIGCEMMIQPKSVRKVRKEPVKPVYAKQNPALLEELKFQYPLIILRETITSLNDECILNYFVKNVTKEKLQEESRLCGMAPELCALLMDDYVKLLSIYNQQHN